jgi:hypothetical protein
MSKSLSRFTFPVLLALCATPAVAADQPVVGASAFAPISPTAALTIEPRDDTDANLHLRDLMAARLRDHRHPVRADAVLRLRFSVDTISDVGPSQGGAASDSVVASDRQPFAATNLSYSEADRFFNPGTDRAERGGVRVSYQLRATLDRRDTGQTVWTGQATIPAGDRNEAQLTAQLAETVADTVGQSLDRSGAAKVAAESTPPSPMVAAVRAPQPAGGALRLPWPSLPELAERR